MRVLTALAALPLLAASVPALAQSDLSTLDGQTIIATITAPQVISILKAQGYEATLSVFDDKTPYVTSDYDGVTFDIYFYNCDEAKARSCEQIQFYTWFNLDKPATTAQMNDFNNDWVAGKARVGTDGAALVEHMVDLYGGVTIDNVVGALDLWTQVIDNFREHLNKL